VFSVFSVFSVVNAVAGEASLEARISFLVELGKRLHVAGVSASRLEGAVMSVARAIGVHCEILSTPTSLLLSLGDAAAPHTAPQTRVLRLEPGNTDLKALALLDEVAELVVKGTIDFSEASERMRVLDLPSSTRRQVANVAAFGLASAAVAGLLRTSWVDVGVALVLGLLIGWMMMLGRTRPHFAAASEAVAALVATTLATAFAHFVAPLSLQTVVVAALIVLMPGLSLTTAVNELATQQLVTGTTRIAGALMTLMKLTFGSIAAAQLARALGWVPEISQVSELPTIIEVASAGVAAMSFAILFRAAKRDVPLVMASAILGYVITRLASGVPQISDASFPGGVFIAGLAVAALANLYGRVVNRPAGLVRVPGIMLLVPGSVGFRALGAVMERDYTLGMETLVAVLSALLALVAGLLFGSLVVPPRRHL
jgi:uncharacterized membrane protein YjjP (DUF1212 family)